MTRYRRLETAQQYEILDELVLYNAEREVALALDGPARMVWELCDGTRTAEEICRDICARLGVDSPGAADELLQDILPPIDQLRQSGLLISEP